MPSFRNRLMPTVTRQNQRLEELTREDGEIITSDSNKSMVDNPPVPKKKSKRRRKISSSSSSSSSSEDDGLSGFFNSLTRKLNSGDRKPFRNINRLLLSQLVPIFRNLDAEGYRCLTSTMEELESEKIEIQDIKKSLQKGTLRTQVKQFLKWVSGVQSLFSQVSCVS